MGPKLPVYHAVIHSIDLLFPAQFLYRRFVPFPEVRGMVGFGAQERTVKVLTLRLMT